VFHAGAFKKESLMRMILAVSVASLLATPVLAADPPAQTPMTRDTGAPVGDNQNSKVAGPEGPVLLEDLNLIEKLARFDRERIPERVVHARGTGAQGVFVASADLSQTY
jgi:catalase